MKIAIDMGHCVSGYDLGARSLGIKEEFLTREVGREVIKKLGFRSRGIKEGSWIYVVRRTKCPAMLIEVCFLDNKSDMDMYRSLGKTKIAEAIVKGLELEDLNSQKDIIQSDPIPEYRKNNMVLRFQKQLNIQFNAKLVEDGILGPKTLAALVNVKKGAKGEITKIIQEILQKKGYNLGSAGVDGVFGQITENVVKAFQKRRNLVSDGIVGINTWKALLD